MINSISKGIEHVPHVVCLVGTVYYRCLGLSSIDFAKDEEKARRTLFTLPE
jgi:hypothetical protein